MTDAQTTLILATASNAEKSLSPWEAVKIFRKAFSWCMFVSLGALLWGYDAQIGGGLLSVPPFRIDFGHILQSQQAQGQGEGGGTGHPDFVIPAKWQSAFNSVSSIGGMFGGLGMGFLADTFGRRTTIAAACLISITGVILQFFCPAHNNTMLLVGKLVNGISLGMFVSSAAEYCAELSPLPLRGITTGAVNLWIVVGQFLSNCVIDGTGTRHDKYAYRIPFALQWIFPVILLAGIAFAPESPWYLVRSGRVDAARNILQRLNDRNSTHPHSSDKDDTHAMDVELQLRQIQETITLEDSYAAQSTYFDCFKGVNRRRTLIALMVFVLQQAVGVIFILGFSTYFFQLAGFDDHNSFRLGVGVTAIGIVGNLTALYMVNALGRRTLFCAGMLGCTLINLAVGIASIPNTSTSKWAMAVMTIIYNFVYQASIGPLGYVIFAEVGSAKLRSKTVGIGICVNSLCSLVMNTVIPYLVNPDEANLGGKVGFIFGGLGSLGTIWTWFCIPETKSRTVDELDELFEMRTGARKFAFTNSSRTRTGTGTGTNIIMHELRRGESENDQQHQHFDSKTV